MHRYNYIHSLVYSLTEHFSSQLLLKVVCAQGWMYLLEKYYYTVNLLINIWSLYVCIHDIHVVTNIATLALHICTLFMYRHIIRILAIL